MSLSFLPLLAEPYTEAVQSLIGLWHALAAGTPISFILIPLLLVSVISSVALHIVREKYEHEPFQVQCCFRSLYASLLSCSALPGIVVPQGPPGAHVLFFLAFSWNFISAHSDFPAWRPSAPSSSGPSMAWCSPSDSSCTASATPVWILYQQAATHNHLFLAYAI